MMGRPRITNPSLYKSKGKRPRWFCRPTIWQFNKAGVLEGKQRTIFFGFCDDVSEDKARSELKRVCDQVNSDTFKASEDDAQQRSRLKKILKHCQVNGEDRERLLARRKRVHEAMSRGSMAEMIAAADLMAGGFEVFMRTDHRSSCDMVAYRDGEFHRVEVKFWSSESRSYNLDCTRNAGKFDVLAIVTSDRSVHYFVPADIGFKVKASKLVELLQPKDSSVQCSQQDTAAQA